MKISFQGEHGAYSEQAVFEHFGADVETVPCAWFDALFDSVASGASDAALAPIENSLAGSIHQNYDLLLRHNLHIVGEHYLRVRHCLIANPAAQKADIRKAISHPQALGQCADYLRAQGIAMEQVYDTAGSVKMLKESGALDTAAIASKRAAELYEMKILEEGIEDNPQNYTRFLVIQREPIVPQAAAKTSILFTLKNIPGSLHKALSAFASRDIDLSKVESRPLQGTPWDYIFYADLIGAAQDEKIKQALAHLGEYALTLRVLGSYPRFTRGL
ncbi:MAG: prephenate dehydratase [Anaerolineales bacterium]|nr:prephenate dehydratase [Anaerolineales bacterium]